MVMNNPFGDPYMWGMSDDEYWDANIGNPGSINVPYVSRPTPHYGNNFSMMVPEEWEAGEGGGDPNVWGTPLPVVTPPPPTVQVPVPAVNTPTLTPTPTPAPATQDPASILGPYQSWTLPPRAISAAIPAVNNMGTGIQEMNLGGGSNTGFGMGGLPGSGWLGGPGRTFLGDPASLWYAGRMAQMSPTQLATPQWTRHANVGFAPTWGQYMLGSPGTDFPTWLQGRTSGDPSGGGMYRTTIDPANWQRALDVSRSLVSGGFENVLDPQGRGIGDTDFNPDLITDLHPEVGRRLGLAHRLTSENARRNTIAMLQARMGGGVGSMADARGAALGNLYNIYAARQAGTAGPPGGFLDWINRRIRGESTPMPTYAAT